MEHGPRRRIVQKVMSECLSRIRQRGECSEDEFARAVADLPALLRESADGLENPPASLATRVEAPGLEGYSLWAESYDENADNPVVAAEEEVIWGIIGEAEGLRVLDVGCGTGRHAVRLAAEGANVVGLDPTPEMLARAVAKAEAAGLAVDLRLGGVEDLDPGQGQFDLVLCCLVLSHVEDLDSAVARLAGHLVPGGRLVISDFHPINLLLGYRTVAQSHDQTVFVPNFLHPVSDYFGAVTSAGLTVTRLLEVGTWKNLAGVPVTLLLQAHRPSTNG
jgi:2-polyprenyl-3-methyl-5-hydroxy-6-metoxy-1,4-benzoquinol methylase